MKKLILIIGLLISISGFCQHGNFMFNQHGAQKSSQDADYLIVRYIWSSEDGKDLDTGTEFTNSNISGLDDNAVGYGLGYTTIDSILTHSGDNTSSGDESFVINIEKLKTSYYFTLLDKTNIDLYGTWFNSKINGGITIEIKSYKGGTISKTGFTFINTGGTLTSIQTIISEVTSTINYSSTWRDDYTYLGYITYNKITDTSIFYL